jgi:Domain of unknown function (DUF4833)
MDKPTRGLISLIVAFASAAFSATTGLGADPCPQHLFVIERSKNANIVAYDANIGPAGELKPSEPVVAYWLMNANKGQREELNALERNHAYGFDVAPSDTPGTYVMAFKASREHRLIVRMHNGCPVAIAPIGGHDGILRRIFVQSKTDSLQQKVEYVELFGEDVAAGGHLYEKFIPGK